MLAINDPEYPTIAISTSTATLLPDSAADPETKSAQTAPPNSTPVPPSRHPIFDQIPLYLRHGPWSPMAHVFIAAVVIALAATAPSAFPTYPNTESAHLQSSGGLHGAFLWCRIAAVCYMASVLGRPLPYPGPARPCLASSLIPPGHRW